MIKRGIELKFDNVYLKKNKKFIFVLEGRYFEKIDKENI